MKRIANIMKKIYPILLIVLLVAFYMPSQSLKAMDSTDNLNTNEEDWYDSSKFREQTYYRTLQEWLKTYREISNVNEVFTTDDNLDLNEELATITISDYSNTVYALAKEETVKFKVNVASSGLYYLALDYQYDTAFSSNPTIDLAINGEAQYNEMEQIRLALDFESIERDEENKYNRYGDELVPYSNPLNKWYHSFVSDCFNETTKPNRVLLLEGENIISITVHDENLLIGNLFIEAIDELISYQEYFSIYQNQAKVNELITIQGENIYMKNDIEIKPSYYKSYKMTPSSYKSQVLNMLDGNSMSRSGTKVTYKFNVTTAGLYELSFKYMQNDLAGLAVGKNIYIDGEIPFSEMEDYLFPYAKKWTNYTLNNGTNNYLFYLSEGLHTISIESTSSHNVDLLDKLYRVMDGVNSLGISINTITGSSSNTAITWKITDYLPNLSNTLIEYADILDDVYNTINAYNPSSKSASEVSTLVVASKALRRLAKSPNKIQNRLAELSEGSGSAYQLVGSAIGYLINQSMDFDYFVFNYAGYKMPSANGNIFGRIWFSIKSFFYSFFDERYNLTLSKDENVIDVLVASSNLYVNIMQEMIDDTFTKETGIKVKLNILSNTQSIVLNNATNTNPDAILDIDSWVPYTYALRGMLADMSKFEGFDEITKDIYSSNFTPLIYGDGVYGMPATQGMQLLFYREDILQSLGLVAPSTWEDVLKMLPTLQSYQMNFYHPLGQDSAYKGFGLTSQFFYMFGSEVYTSNGFTTNISNENSVQAIKFMTDLFNIYNLPQQVASFFEHFRSGSLPIGIAGIDMYLQLKYACPELSGQWNVLPIPGMYNSATGEVERWTSTYGKCSIMFKASTKQDKTWEFIKWWHSASTQGEYVQKIKTYLGERYLIVPANIEALSSSPWDYQIKQQIIDAAKWSRIPAITPGSYIIEREISNIWNEVVIDKINVRVAINQSVPKINRELARKFEEFGYLDNGKILKEYLVPTNQNIYGWVKGKDYYE